jgi:threonine dehydrogenase-like Zn-dependent dehydrogenase
MGNGGRGSSGKELRIGDRMVVAFPIACGKCFLVSAGHSPDSFGYSHMTGGNAGGQAEYARVPLLMSVPFRIADEKVLFLSTSSDRLHGCRKLQSPSRPYCGGRLSA